MTPIDSKAIKALIPAAGYGSRLAGIGGDLPKELLPIGSLSMIEHSLGMVIDSGVIEVCIVIRPGKEAAREVCERYWERYGPRPGSLTFLEQNPPRGVAEAMSLAGKFAGDAPLAVIMPDNMLIGGQPALSQMIEVFKRIQDNVIGVIPLDPSRANLFGSVGRITLSSPNSSAPPLVATFSAKERGSLLTVDRSTYYKGLIGVIYVPGWQERILDLRPASSREWDDTDLVIDLVRESRLWAAVMKGTGFDLGHPAGLIAARQSWDRLNERVQ